MLGLRSTIYFFYFMSLAAYSADISFIGLERPHFYFSNSDKVTGYLFHIIDTACKESKITCAFQITKDHPTVFKKIATGEADAEITPFPPPEDKSPRSNPEYQISLLKNPYVSAGISNKEDIKSLSNLSGFKIIINNKRGYFMSLKAKLKKVDNLVEIFEESSTTTNILKKINDGFYGKNVFVMVSKAELNHFMETTKDAKIKFFFTHKLDNYGILFPPKPLSKNMELLKSNLIKLKSSPEFKNIIRESKNEIFKINQ